MPKLTEKALYQTWLDIHYAHRLNKDMVHDLELEMKELKKGKTKSKKLLKKASDAYEKLYGKPPELPKIRRY